MRVVADTNVLVRAVILASLVDDPDDPNAPPEFVQAWRRWPRWSIYLSVSQHAPPFAGEAAHLSSGWFLQSCLADE